MGAKYGSDRGCMSYICLSVYVSADILLDTIDMGQKLGAVPPFMGGGAGSPSSTMWPGPRPTSIPSGHSSMPSAILIHPAVWPE